MNSPSVSNTKNMIKEQSNAPSPTLSPTSTGRNVTGTVTSPSSSSSRNSMSRMGRAAGGGANSSESLDLSHHESTHVRKTLTDEYDYEDIPLSPAGKRGSYHNKMTNRNNVPGRRSSMRLSLPDESKEVNWLLMVFDPEVTNVHEEDEYPDFL